MKILLVDDEPFIVQGLQAMIEWEKYGCEIAGTAGNGQEALAFLKENTVDLIIADIRMPVMDGLELLAKIRKEKISDAWFVILSGYSDFQYAREALRYECMDYILKPVKKEELEEILEKAGKLQEKRLEQEKREEQRDRAVMRQKLIAVFSDEEAREQGKDSELLPVSCGEMYFLGVEALNFSGGGCRRKGTEQ